MMACWSLPFSPSSTFCFGWLAGLCWTLFLFWIEVFVLQQGLLILCWMLHRCNTEQLSSPSHLVWIFLQTCDFIVIFSYFQFHLFILVFLCKFCKLFLLLFILDCFNFKSVFFLFLEVLYGQNTVPWIYKYCVSLRKESGYTSHRPCGIIYTQSNFMPLSLDYLYL